MTEYEYLAMNGMHKQALNLGSVKAALAPIGAAVERVGKFFRGAPERARQAIKGRYHDIGWIDNPEAVLDASLGIPEQIPVAVLNKGRVAKDVAAGAGIAGTPIAAYMASKAVAGDRIGRDIADTAAGNYGRELPKGYQDKQRKKQEEREADLLKSKLIGTGVGALGGGALGYGAGHYFGLTPAQKILTTLLGGAAGGGLGYYVGSEMGKGDGKKSTPKSDNKKDSK